MRSPYKVKLSIVNLGEKVAKYVELLLQDTSTPLVDVPLAKNCWVLASETFRQVETMTPPFDHRTARKPATGTLPRNFPAHCCGQWLVRHPLHLLIKKWAPGCDFMSVDDFYDTVELRNSASNNIPRGSKRFRVLRTKTAAPPGELAPWFMKSAVPMLASAHKSYISKQITH